MIYFQPVLQRKSSCGVPLSMSRRRSSDLRAGTPELIAPISESISEMLFLATRLTRAADSIPTSLQAEV